MCPQPLVVRTELTIIVAQCALHINRPSIIIDYIWWVMVLSGIMQTFAKFIFIDKIFWLQGNQNEVQPSQRGDPDTGDRLFSRLLSGFFSNLNLPSSTLTLTCQVVFGVATLLCAQTIFNSILESVSPCYHSDQPVICPPPIATGGEGGNNRL